MISFDFLRPFVPSMLNTYILCISSIENAVIIYTLIYFCTMQHIIDTPSRHDIEHGPVPISALLKKLLILSIRRTRRWRD